MQPRSEPRRDGAEQVCDDLRGEGRDVSASDANTSAEIEMYRALVPASATLPESRLIGISSIVALAWLHQKPCRMIVFS